jgi:hypothetical protein
MPILDENEHSSINLPFILVYTTWGGVTACNTQKMKLAPKIGRAPRQIGVVTVLVLGLVQRALKRP